MTNGELREKLALALEDMKAKAIEMGIEGVATATNWLSPSAEQRLKRIWS